MPTPNRNLNQRMRQALYSLKREYGGTIDIYKLNSSSTDVRTGTKTVSKEVYRVERAIIMPAIKDRTITQGIAQISANKEFAFGGTYDESVRSFIVDRRDVPNLPDLTASDWIVFNGRKHQIKSVETFEFDAGWVITAKELVGERPEQIFLMRADHLLAFSQVIATG